MKSLLITGLVALLGTVQPALAQDYDRYDRDNQDRRSGDRDWNGDQRYDARYDQRSETRRGGRYDSRYGVGDRTSRYGQAIMWQGVAYNRPRSSNFAWENSQNLNRRDGLSEIELWADARASQAWLEVVEGAVQFDRGEVIYRDGSRQPIYMRGLTRGRGFYPLADFGGWREVSRVRLLARALTPGARVGLHLME